MDKKIKEVFCKSFNIEDDGQIEVLAFNSIPQWDSLGHVKLIMGIGSCFNMKIPPRDIPSLNSYSKIYQYINNFFGRLTNSKTEVSGPIVNRGLKETYYDVSSICLIDQEKGLFYRGIHIEKLVNLSFEKVAFLILNNNLPSEQGLSSVKESLFAGMHLNSIQESIIEGYSFLPIGSILLMILASENGNFNEEDFSHSSFRLIGLMAACICFHYNVLNNTPKKIPLERLNFSENFCYMLGLDKLPFFEKVCSVMNKDFILHAEHESNASTFSARIAASTESDVISCIMSAICAFSGDLHGGALIKINEQLDYLANLSTEDINKVLKSRLENSKPIYGFGHRVYINEDPRSFIYRNVLTSLENDFVLDKSLETIKIMEDVVSSYSSIGLKPNVDLFCCVLYRTLNIKKDYFISFFILSRIIGWLSHIKEQKNNNVLIRPRLLYNGKLE
jgi:citrate synthase